MLIFCNVNIHLTLPQLYNNLCKKFKKNWPPPPQCQDSVLGQRTEEERQVKQDLQRAQSLFTSAERELRYEREKSLDLKKHNTLLEQEKLKVQLQHISVCNATTTALWQLGRIRNQTQ